MDSKGTSGEGNVESTRARGQGPDYHTPGPGPETLCEYRIKSPGNPPHFVTLPWHFPQPENSTLLRTFSGYVVCSEAWRTKAEGELS